MVRALWQAIQDINNLLDDPEWRQRGAQIGAALKAIGEWMIAQFSGVGAAADDEVDLDEAISQVTQFLEKQQVPIPMMASGQSRLERLKALLEIAGPLLFKLLLM
ncbi:MAG: hypothetical protein E6Q97_33210 [Desulfurellales bacterium]|nr:MAG: hypothetical protein E6Q97_33210 [Desulfurellales bacterium]